MARSGCGTCRGLHCISDQPIIRDIADSSITLDRKVLCDRAIPKCNRCIKAGRPCQGYGTRLSWPRRHDPRRAIVGPAPAPVGKPIAIARTALRLVNASSHDIELFELVSNSADAYGTLLQGVEITHATGINVLPVNLEVPLSLLKTPSSYATMQLNPKEKDLFQYCQTIISPYPFPILTTHITQLYTKLHI